MMFLRTVHDQRSRLAFFFAVRLTCNDRVVVAAQRRVEVKVKVSRRPRSYSRTRRETFFSCEIDEATILLPGDVQVWINSSLVARRDGAAGAIDGAESLYLDDAVGSFYGCIT